MHYPQQVRNKQATQGGGIRGLKLTDAPADTVRGSSTGQTATYSERSEPTCRLPGEVK